MYIIILVVVFLRGVHPDYVFTPVFAWEQPSYIGSFTAWNLTEVWGSPAVGITIMLSTNHTYNHAYIPPSVTLVGYLDSPLIGVARVAVTR